MARLRYLIDVATRPSPMAVANRVYALTGSEWAATSAAEITIAQYDAADAAEYDRRRR
jgi:hypothetical protein